MHTADNLAAVALEVAQGPDSAAVRTTLDQATAVLRPVMERHRSIDARYVLQLVREQVRIALYWPNRRTQRAWKQLVKAVDECEAACFDFPIRSQIRGGLKRARREIEQAGGRFTDVPQARLADEIYERQRSEFGRLREQLEHVQRVFDLPQNAERNGGRPTSFRSDAVASLLRDHFTEHTGSARWPLIARLLACAPGIRDLSLEPNHVRQRLNRWQREDRAPESQSVTLSQWAYELKRRLSSPVELPPVLKERRDAMRQRAESLEQAERRWSGMK